MFLECLRGAAARNAQPTLAFMLLEKESRAAGGAKAVCQRGSAFAGDSPKLRLVYCEMCWQREFGESRGTLGGLSPRPLASGSPIRDIRPFYSERLPQTP